MKTDLDRDPRRFPGIVRRARRQERPKKLDYDSIWDMWAVVICVLICAAVVYTVIAQHAKQLDRTYHHVSQ
jgi:hypothetical protein